MIVLLSQAPFGLFIMAILLTLASIFMILLILVQQGRGGGLTGALGGMGGQSAFGAKAGDLFTRITIITAVVWIMLSVFTIAIFNAPPQTGLQTTNNSGARSEDSGPVEALDENAPPLNPPKADGDAAAVDGLQLNPPENAVPKQTPPAEEQKTDPPKDDAPKNDESRAPASGDPPKTDDGKN